MRKLKQDLCDFMELHGAFDVGIADPTKGFEHSEPDRHPLHLMPNCRSVLVFLVPRSPAIHYWNVGWRRPVPRQPGRMGKSLLDQSSASDYHVSAIVFLMLAHISLNAITYLHDLGYEAIDAQILGAARKKMVHSKLCAYEAGLGVYGRSGLMLHPTLGNRIGIGVILTNAVLPADQRLEDFNPCAWCSICVDRCPGDAYGSEKKYHNNWSRNKCLSSGAEGVACVECWQPCPACRIDEESLFTMASRYKHSIERIRDAAANISDRLSYFPEQITQK